MQNWGDEAEEEWFEGRILPRFIREKIQETLLEASFDCRVLYSAMDAAAARYSQGFLAQIVGESAGSSGSAGAAQILAGSRKLDEMHQDQMDAADSLRAGQMEIRLAIERNWRSAETFLPLIESRLGRVYGRLHQTTKRLLTLGEYFRSINQSEPDAMNVVVLHQTKACEHELYMRVFGPYLIYLLSEGVTEYLVDGTCKSPLLRQGKEVPRNMAIANYCWYLKHDSKLQGWIESTLKLSLPVLINEAYWILEQRNLAAHENDYKEYNLAIFQQRLFSSNGLLGCLHTGA